MEKKFESVLMTNVARLDEAVKNFHQGIPSAICVRKGKVEVELPWNAAAKYMKEFHPTDVANFVRICFEMGIGIMIEEENNQTLSYSGVFPEFVMMLHDSEVFLRAYKNGVLKNVQEDPTQVMVVDKGTVEQMSRGEAGSLYPSVMTPLLDRIGIPCVVWVDEKMIWIREV